MHGQLSRILATLGVYFAGMPLLIQLTWRTYRRCWSSPVSLPDYDRPPASSFVLPVSNNGQSLQRARRHSVHCSKSNRPLYESNRGRAFALTLQKLIPYLPLLAPVFIWRASLTSCRDGITQ